MRKSYAAILGILALSFFLRVLGQVLVGFFRVDFLPPMAEWYSGLIPYPVLLPIQLSILMLQAKISSDLYRGRGVFAFAGRAPARFCAGSAMFTSGRWCCDTSSRCPFIPSGDGLGERYQSFSTGSWLRTCSCLVGFRFQRTVVRCVAVIDTGE